MIALDSGCSAAFSMSVEGLEGDILPNHACPLFPPQISASPLLLFGLPPISITMGFCGFSSIYVQGFTFGALPVGTGLEGSVFLVPNRDSVAIAKHPHIYSPTVLQGVTVL